MATPEEILELKGEIRKLSVAIEGLETLSKDTTDKNEKKDLRDEISLKTKLLITKQETLNLYLRNQQGKFLHIFPLPFPNLLDVILCPLSFDISSSSIQVWRLLKVRSDGNIFSSLSSLIHFECFI